MNIIGLINILVCLLFISKTILAQEFKAVVETGNPGGLIAVDRDGNIAMPFNTNAMFRGFVKSDGTRETAIY